MDKLVNITMGNCIIEGCGRKSIARKLCTRHYQQAKKSNILNIYPKAPIIRNAPSPCKVAHCFKLTRYGSKYCSMHESRLRRTGSLEPSSVSSNREKARTAPNGMHWCRKCDKYLPNTDFFIMKNGPSAGKIVSCICKKCDADDKLRRAYRLSTEARLEILIKQNGSCAVCGIKESALNRKLAVDHCHSTHKIRGLLCPNCNRGIGLFKDNPDRLRKAADYLESKT